MKAGRVDVRVVIDTNVLIAALRSDRGASSVVISLIGAGRFENLLSVPLAAEYEEQCAAFAATLTDSEAQARVATILHFVFDAATHYQIFFTWRPLLGDPDDEMLVDLAVTAGAEFIVTHNVRDLSRAASLGVIVVTPAQFLAILRERP